MLEISLAYNNQLQNIDSKIRWFLFFHFCEELCELLNHIDFRSFRQKHRFEQWT